MNDGHLRRAVLLSCTVLALLYLWPRTAQAQAPGQPSIQIMQVDTSHFPLLAVTVSGRYLPAPLADLPLQVTLDDHPLAIATDETVQSGLQLALAIDGNDLFRRGQAGQSGYIETLGTVRTLIESSALARDQDWLAAYLLQGALPPQPIQEWTQDPDLLFNRIVGNRPAEITATPLSTATVSALLTQLAAKPAATAAATAAAKALILFTAGAPFTAVEPLIAQAEAAAVTVHVVALLETQAATTGLQQLAAATGGHYVALDDPTMIAPLASALTETRTVRRVQVRAETAMPQGLAVTLTLPDGAKVTAAADSTQFQGVTVAPVAIAITSPATTTVDWAALAPAPTEPTLRLFPVQAVFTWPDQQPRQLVQVTYTLRGPGGLARQEIRTAAPFDQTTLTVPIPEADAVGDYTLEVMALDELGLEAVQSLTFLSAPAASSTTTTAAQTEAQAGAPAVTTTAIEPAETIIVPGLDLQLSRPLLIWLLPVLLLLIAYLIYSERRDRRQREAGGTDLHALQNRGQRPSGVFALKADAHPQPRNRFQLKPAAKRAADAYVMEGEALREEAPLHRGAPGRAPSRLPAAPERPIPFPTSDESPARLPEADALAWAHTDEDTYAEATDVPQEDEEATYRTQAVARPIIGYLLRSTSDPNLPKELPIYGLNPAPGQTRQIYIGRHSKHNTVVINDKRVSREHAVLIQRDGQLFLRDNASTAGTFLNWKRLNPGEELLLRTHDLIGFGQIAYEFQAYSEDDATMANQT